MCKTSTDLGLISLVVMIGAYASLWIPQRAGRGFTTVQNRIIYCFSMTGAMHTSGAPRATPHVQASVSPNILGLNTASPHESNVRQAPFLVNGPGGGGLEPCATDAPVSLPSTPDKSVCGGGAVIPQPSAAVGPALPHSLLPHPADLHHHPQHTAGTVSALGSQHNFKEPCQCLVAALC